MFRARVLNVVRRIPPGRVATYGDVAAAAGNARACRAVGNIMRDCQMPGMPCHRVIAAGGQLGGYGGNIDLKRSLLRAEGVRVVGTTIRNFAACRWPTAGPAAGRTAESPRNVHATPIRKATRRYRGRV